jgi:hypothetical protein
LQGAVAIFMYQYRPHKEETNSVDKSWIIPISGGDPNRKTLFGQTVGSH